MFGALAAYDVSISNFYRLSGFAAVLATTVTATFAAFSILLAYILTHDFRLALDMIGIHEKSLNFV